MEKELDYLREVTCKRYPCYVITGESNWTQYQIENRMDEIRKRCRAMYVRYYPGVIDPKAVRITYRQFMELQEVPLIVFFDK